MSQPSAATSSAAPSGVAARTAARPAIEFKGLSHPALRLVIHEPADGSIAAAMDALIADDPGFEWQPVVIDASRIAAGSPPDWDALVARLRAARLHPVALAGAPEAERDTAERLQLGWLATVHERRRPIEPAPEPAREAAAEPAREATATPVAAATGEPVADGAQQELPLGDEAARAEAARAAPAAEHAPAPAAAVPDAMVIDRPVRSGQQLYARGRDLVVVGDVSPGAEVIADGNVHVYGTLAGRAIAGARGLRGASIFALDLRAELVAVCGIYRTFEDGIPKAHSGKPVRITLEQNADTLSMTSL